MDYEDLSQIVSHTRFNLYCHLVSNKDSLYVVPVSLAWIHLISLESVQQYMCYLFPGAHISNYIY